jgi:tetratricopeptide (TPR) repeat protein
MAPKRGKGRRGEPGPKRRREQGKARSPVQGAPDTQRRRSAILASLLLIALVAFAIMRRRDRTAAPGAVEALPAPAAALPADTIAMTDFVGAQRCAECHAREFAAWRPSTHAAAGGRPGDVRVIAAFNGTPIRFQDATVVPSANGGRFQFIVRQSGRPDVRLPVDAVVGGGHMEGGGTQGFVTRWADGTYRFLPFDYSRHGGFWFCNTTGRAGRAWVPITADISIAACADWPPARVLGDEPRFNNCQSCHGSQIDVALDTTAREYRTRFSSLAIGCESCHGPGRRHIALVADPAAVASGDIGMAPLATLSADSSLGTCLACHALKDRLRPGYLSGKRIETHYSLRLPQLGDAAHFPDGRVRTFAYQEGHLYSDCYVDGGMTCTSCHDPHSQRYRDVTGTPLGGRFDDRQCTSCHASKADSASAHARHRAGTPGSACVSCHMPYLQEPEVGSVVRYARSDHAIPIPRPAFDSSLGIVSACRGCHRDRSESALDAQVREWYGELKPHARAIDALTRAASVENPADAARLLLVPEERHTAALFAGMAAFLDRHLALDMDALDGDAVARLRALARHRDLDVRALALASLHYARGNERGIRDFLARELGAMGRDEDAIRARWAVTLGYLADRLRAGGNASAAVGVYRKAQEIAPGNAAVALNLGLAHAEAGNPAAAIEQYERSLSLAPAQPLTLVNLGIAKGDRGDVSGAMDAYRRALALDPREPLAHYNLGAAYLRQGAADSAAAHFERTVELDPSLAPARFYLARILGARGDVAGALRQVEAGLQFDQRNADALAMRDALRRGLRP